MAKYTDARCNKFAIVLGCPIVYYSYRIVHLVSVTSKTLGSNLNRCNSGEVA